jgi:K+-sensing histidine kinase KdpD
MAQQRHDPEQRPSPEGLLEAARREDGRVGRLKIFVGAAPGVGKAYEMLQSAHVRLKASVKVVVGMVETHGRAENRRAAAGPRSHPAQVARIQGPDPRGNRPQCGHRASVADRAGRRTRAHQRSRQPSSQALLYDARSRRGLSEQEERDLLVAVIDESERRNRFIANLLDVTKLGSGAVVPNTARHDIGEIVGSALRRASKILVRHKVSLELLADLPLLELDAVLFEQVLFNLLDNAAKYAPADTTIWIRGSRERDLVSLQIIDEGESTPPGEQENVFDKFYRAQKGDHVRPGAGQGLAICHGFVEAMHGTISAADRTDRSGAVLTIGLPIPAAVDALETAA